MLEQNQDLSPAFAVLPLEDAQEQKALLRKRICERREAVSNVSTVLALAVGPPKVHVDRLRNGHHLSVPSQWSPPVTQCTHV